MLKKQIYITIDIQIEVMWSLNIIINYVNNIYKLNSKSTLPNL